MHHVRLHSQSLLRNLRDPKGGLWRLNTEKIRVPKWQWRSNISWRGRKPNCEKKKPKATYSVALVMAFLAAENENRQLEDLPQADFGRVPERFLLTVRSNSITDNFAYWKLGPLFVFEVIQRIFSSWVRQRAIFIWGLSILLFLFINKVDIFVSEGLLCLYEKRVQLKEKFHIYARPSIILYVFILWNIDSIIVINITHKLAFTLWKLTFPYTRIAL